MLYDDLFFNNDLFVQQTIRACFAKLNLPAPLRSAVLYLLEGGGRRFRSRLAFAVAEGLGRGIQPIHAATSLEFFHTASLIADDLPCMDDDETRRDRPCLHKEFGEATALLVSYGFIAEGYRLLTQDVTAISAVLGEKAALERTIFMVNKVSQSLGFQGAVLGQYYDLFPQDFLLESLETTTLLKTGELFRISFLVGWVFGGGDLALEGQISSLARRFGVLFQLADDLQDHDHDLTQEHKINFAIALGREQSLDRIEKERTELEAEVQSLFPCAEKLLKLLDRAIPRGCAESATSSLLKK